MSHRCRLASQLLIALSVAWGGMPAWANNFPFDALEMPLEELVQVQVISTPKFAENPELIPAQVSILQRQDIRTYGWRTLGDALRSLQGFNVTNDHTYQHAGIRGISLPGDFRPRLRLLIDGMSVNENIYASAPTDDSFPLDLDLVERIEVIRGPSASVYGGDAMFGVINVVTRSGHAIDGTELAVGVGSGWERQGRATWGGRLENGTDVMVSASSRRKNGQDLLFSQVGEAGAAQQANGIDRGESDKLFIRARGDDWRLAFTYSDREVAVPTGSYGTVFNDLAHRERDQYTLGEIAKDWRLSDDSSLHQRLYFGKYDYNAVFPYAYDSLIIANHDRGRGQWWGLDHHFVTRPTSEQRWTLGLEYRSDVRQDFRNEDPGYGCYEPLSASPCLNTQHDSRTLTFFAQDEIRLTTATLLTVGMRFDQLNEGHRFWSPRLGVTHDAQGLGIFKFLYGTAFRMPSPYENHYFVVSTPYGNPGLQSEKMRSFELNWEKRFGPDRRLTATIYQFDIERMIAADATTGLASNGSDVRGRGLELGYEERWRNGVTLRGNYSLQRAHNAEGGLDNSPRYMLKMNLGLPTGITDLTVGFEAQHISRRLAAAGSEQVSAFTLANLNFLYAPLRAPWDVSLGIYNLFDQRYQDPVSPEDQGGRWFAPQLQRSAFLKTTFRF